MSKKKQTAGERIAGIPPHGSPLWQDMTNVELDAKNMLSRRIDAAILKAVAKALTNERRGKYETSTTGVTPVESLKIKPPRSRKP